MAQWMGVREVQDLLLASDLYRKVDGETSRVRIRWRPERPEGLRWAANGGRARTGKWDIRSECRADLARCPRSDAHLG